MALTDWNGNGNRNDSFDNWFEYNLITGRFNENRNSGSGCGCLSCLIIVIVITFAMGLF